MSKININCKFVSVKKIFINPTLIVIYFVCLQYRPQDKPGKPNESKTDAKQDSTVPEIVKVSLDNYAEENSCFSFDLVKGKKRAMTMTVTNTSEESLFLRHCELLKTCEVYSLHIVTRGNKDIKIEPGTVLTSLLRE